MKAYLSREVYSSIIVGSITCTLVVLSTDIETLHQYVRSLMPPGVVVYYLAALSVLSFVVKWIRHFFIRCRFLPQRFTQELYAVSQQVGSSLIGLYRALAGSLLVVVPSIVYVDPAPETYFYALSALLFSFACIAVCCALSVWQEEIVPSKYRQKDFIYGVNRDLECW